MKDKLPSNLGLQNRMMQEVARKMHSFLSEHSVL
jgi:hypothetical protein